MFSLLLPIVLFATFAIVVLFRLRTFVVFALVASVCGASLTILSVDTAQHYGIAPGAPVLDSTLLLTAAAIFVWGVRREAIWMIVSGALCVWLIILIVLQWGNSSAQWSGFFHVSFAMLAYVAGRQIGADMPRNSRTVWAFLLAVGLLVLVQVILAVPQSLGVAIGRYPAEAALFSSQSRAIGLFNHPSLPGKFVFVTLPVLLAFTRLGSKKIARCSWLVIFLGTILTALTLSRANFIAVVATLFLWMFLSPRVSVSRRISMLVAVLMLAIPFVSIYLLRITNDPDGGDRPALLETGLRTISESWFFGIGVNSYSDVVGRYDALAATGFPVHNFFLLSVAEMGVLGGVLLALPLFSTVVRSLRTLRADGVAGAAARALVCSLPGVVLVTFTGWGMLAEALPTWYLALGVAAGLIAYRERFGSAVSSGRYHSDFSRLLVRS